MTVINFNLLVSQEALYKSHGRALPVILVTLGKIYSVPPSQGAPNLKKHEKKTIQ